MENDYSVLDNFKLMVVDINLDPLTFGQIIRMLSDDENISERIAKCLSFMGRDDVLAFVGDLVSSAIEMERGWILYPIFQFISKYIENDETEYFYELYFIANPFVHNSAIETLLPGFSHLTPSTVMMNILSIDRKGNMFFALDRIQNILAPHLNVDELSKFRTFAQKNGKLDLVGILDRMIDVRRYGMPCPVDNRDAGMIERARKGERLFLDRYEMFIKGGMDISYDAKTLKTSAIEGFYMDLINNMKDFIDTNYFVQMKNKFIDLVRSGKVNMNILRGMLAWSMIENSESLKTLYGPHWCPKGTIEMVQEPRLFFMLFNDIGYRLQDGIDEEIEMNPSWAVRGTWFTGRCEYDGTPIPEIYYAVRRPRINGGWIGCYHSPRNILLDVISKYAIPDKNIDGCLTDIESQFISFFKSILGIDNAKSGYSILVRENIYLQDNSTNQFVDMSEIRNKIFRLPKIVVRGGIETDAMDIEQIQDYANGNSFEKYSVGLTEDILSKTNPTITGSNTLYAIELIRNGGPPRKYEKEVVMKREDILTFALVKSILY